MAVVLNLTAFKGWALTTCLTLHRFRVLPHPVPISPALCQGWTVSHPCALSCAAPPRTSFALTKAPGPGPIKMPSLTVTTKFTFPSQVILLWKRRWVLDNMAVIRESESMVAMKRHNARSRLLYALEATASSVVKGSTTEYFALLSAWDFQGHVVKLPQQQP